MKRTMLILLTLGLLATACGKGTSAAPDGDPFGATTWQLTEGTVDGTPLVLTSSPVTLSVSDGEISGRAACNSYGGPIEVDAGTITMGMLFQTEMACLDDDVMRLEQAFLAGLARVTRVATDGSTLVLTGEGVEFRFAAAAEPEPVALRDTRWSLDTIVDGDTASTPVASATLRIAEDGSVTGSTGCNAISGTYSPTDGFDLVITLIACLNTSVMDQERLVLGVLGSNPDLAVDGDLLTATAASGLALVYRAEPEP